MKPSSSDKNRVRELVATVADSDRHLDGVAAVWVRDCWLASIEVANSRKRLNRRMHLACRYVAYTGALVLPILAGISTIDPKSSVRVWTFAVSLVVALATGASQVFKFGQQWRIHEEFAAAMEAEGWSYFQQQGSYDGSPSDAYALFFERIEVLRRRRGDQFILEIGADVANLEGTENGSRGPNHVN